jgi:hypothetical protein
MTLISDDADYVTIKLNYLCMSLRNRMNIETNKTKQINVYHLDINNSLGSFMPTMN